MLGKEKKKRKEGKNEGGKEREGGREGEGGRANQENTEIASKLSRKPDRPPCTKNSSGKALKIFCKNNSGQKCDKISDTPCPQSGCIERQTKLRFCSCQDSKVYRSPINIKVHDLYLVTDVDQNPSLIKGNAVG